MKQILFCYKEDRKLRIRSTILTDVYVPVQDVISPQKTTLKILETDKVEISDIIIIRDNDSGKIEYIGYIDTITTKTTTEISCYPLINVFDNDYVLDQMFVSAENDVFNLETYSVYGTYADESPLNSVHLYKDLTYKIDTTYPIAVETGKFTYSYDYNNNKIIINLSNSSHKVEIYDIDKLVFYKNGNVEYYLPKKDSTPNYIDTSVDIVNWLTNQLKREFVDTDDDYQALPLIIRSQCPYPVFYKKALDTANLFEAYTDIFVNTGVYIEFNELHYDGYYIDGIYCDICCNTVDKPIYLRYDNPQIQSVDIVDNTFTNYNKLIATQEQEEDENGNLIPATEDLQRYVFYLLDDNSVTTNPKDSRRFKQVRSKAITFQLKDIDDDEKERISIKYSSEGYTGDGLTKKIEEEILHRQAQALLLEVYNELQASEYNLAITITMFANDKIKLHKLVDFVAESGTIYTSRITKLEILNDKQIKITLGALRNSLTDFKKKIEEI